MKLTTVVACMVFLSSLRAQESASKPAPKADVRGSCNGTAVGNNVTIVVHCGEGATSAAEAKKLAGEYQEVIKQIRTGNLKIDDVLSRLKEMQKTVNDIKSEVGGRHLSPDQVTALKRFASEQTLTRPNFIFSYDNLPESRAYAHEWMTALAIPEDSTTIVFMSATPIVGPVLYVSDEDQKARNLPAVCEALAKLLTEQHLPFKAFYVPSLTAGQCGLTIGEKPTE